MTLYKKPPTLKFMADFISLVGWNTFSYLQSDNLLPPSGEIFNNQRLLTHCSLHLPPNCSDLNPHEIFSGTIKTMQFVISSILMSIHCIAGCSIINEDNLLQSSTRKCTIHFLILESNLNKK